jgi:zinc protease
MRFAILAGFLTLPALPGFTAGAAEQGLAKVERFQLDNGLRVLLRPVGGAKDVAVVVLFNLGDDHDPKGKCGLGHLVEHLYVTAAAGETKARTAEEFFARYPKGGNAQTGSRYTVIATVFPQKDLEKELKDAAARMGDLSITAADLAREQKRVIDEVGFMFEGPPPLAAMNHGREMIRPTPLSGRKSGLAEHVKGITLDEVQQRWKAYYKPANAVLVVAGGVDGKAVRKQIEEHFGKLPAGTKAPPPEALGKPVTGVVRERAVRPVVAGLASEACVVYRAPAMDSDLYPAFLVLARRLIGQSGDLKVGGGRHPVSFAPLDEPDGVYISVPVGKEETGKQAIERLDAFVAKVIEAKLTPADVERAREVYGTLLGFSTRPMFVDVFNPYLVAFSLGRLEQAGVDAAKLEERLQKVTEQDVRRAAREVFAPERRAGIIITVKDEGK